MLLGAARLACAIVVFALLFILLTVFVPPFLWHDDALLFHVLPTTEAP